MRIIHVMADGTVRENIKDHVVKVDEAKEFYCLLHKINKENRGK